MLNVEQLKFILEQLQEEYDTYIYCAIFDIIRDKEFDIIGYNEFNDIPCINCKFRVERDNTFSTCCSYSSVRKGFI